MEPKRSAEPTDRGPSLHPDTKLPIRCAWPYSDEMELRDAAETPIAADVDEDDGAAIVHRVNNWDALWEENQRLRAEVDRLQSKRGPCPECRRDTGHRPRREKLSDFGTP